MPKTIPNYEELKLEVEKRLFSHKSPFLLAIVGPPAAGKSTMAMRLILDLKASGYSGAYCSMDGFHKTNEILISENLFPFKGRIETFDGHAFSQAINRVINREAFWWPRYSRQLHDPVLEGTKIEGTESIYAIEGNFLLSRTEPWMSLSSKYHLKVFIDTSDEILQKRLYERHLLGGKGSQEILTKIKETDLYNAHLVRKDKEYSDLYFFRKDDE